MASTPVGDHDGVSGTPSSNGAHSGPGVEEWVLRAIPDGLWVLDEHGTTTYANEAAALLLDVDPVATAGLSAYDVLDRRDHQRFRDHLADLARGHVLEDELELSLRRGDGSTRTVAARVSPVTDDHGQVRGWVHRLVERTGPAVAAWDLERRERRLAAAFRTARMGTWQWDVHAGVLTGSPELLELCEVSSITELTYAALADRMMPEDRTAFRDAITAALETPQALEFDFPLDSDTGVRRWFRGRGRSWGDAGGRVVGLAGTAQDVTEHKENDMALAFLSAMGRAANEAGTLHEVLLAAEALVRPYAQWPAVVISAPYSRDSDQLFHLDVGWDDGSEARGLLARELAEQVAREQELTCVVGPEGTVLVAGAVVAGGRLGCVLVCDTLRTTPLSAVDERVYEQMLTLLASVAQREWAAEDLAAARDEALQASRAKSEFQATMSHEIRTPLNGVLGLSELLASTDLTAHQRRLSRGVDQAGRTLLALVNDILDLSKVEAGRLDLEEVGFDPVTVVESSVELVADTAREKRLELVVAVASDVPALVLGDPVRFGQVITNLAANAVKFTSRGEVVLRVLPLEGGRLRVEVRDTGIGISRDAADRLFQAFSQADSSTTREYGGTGLGLAISKRIVGAMGGEIGLESEPGRGSTFWFEVPLPAASDQDSGGTGTGDLETLRREPLVGLRVLVVDDNETNRLILSERLTGLQMVVGSVDSAAAALRALDQASESGAAYDLALLDYMMPGTDGEQLARRVRADARHDGTRLGLLSSVRDHRAGFLEGSGVEVVLSKPVLPSHLVDALLVLAREGQPCQERRTPPSRDVPGPAGARGRVLVVEDNPVNQLVAEGVLERCGYEVVIADDGAAGLAAFTEDPRGFDAILMDCQMPVLDGYAATRAIRAREVEGSRVPVIAMTAAVVAEERERCVSAGMDDFVSKPVDVALLESTLRRWIPERSVSAPVEHPTFDPTRIRELLDEGAADEDLVRRMITRFAERATLAQHELAEASASGSADDVVRVAHSLRGGAANLGMSALARLCEAMELAAHRGEVPSARRLHEVDVELAAAQVALGRVLLTAS
jgi:hypothetical protein